VRVHGDLFVRCAQFLNEIGAAVRHQRVGCHVGMHQRNGCSHNRVVTVGYVLQYALHRPAQVHGGGAGTGNALCVGQDGFDGRSCPLGVERKQRNTKGPGGADGGCAAHCKAADRVDYLLGGGEVQVFEAVGEYGLVDDHDLALDPIDGAHGGDTRFVGVDTVEATRADLLIVNAVVVTVNAVDEVVGGARGDGAIAVAGGRVVAVGLVDDVREAWRGGDVIDAKGGIVAPGFVNLHAHLAMTLFRGWADDRDLQAFLDRLFPAEAAIVSPESVQVGVDLAIAESIRAGITTTLDMYFHPEVAGERAVRAGVRIANGPVVFSFPGPDGMAFDKRMAWADEALGIAVARGTAAARGELTGGRWLCPHGTYTIELAHLEAVRDLAAKHDAGITIHAAETKAEVANVVAATGRRPVELLDDLGMLSPKIVLAHAVELTDHEIERIAATGATVSHNPLSNMKLASGFARVPDLLAAGVTVGLGTDGTASSNDLDLFLAMRFAATIHKGARLDANVVTARQALRMATIDGARALGLAHELGSIEVGKLADLQILHADHPNLVPSYDPVSTLVFAAGRADVRTVVVGGRVVLRDGSLTTVDLDATVAAARRIANDVRATGS
jgi:5-methylthioadenosine/S-adenosylhomocysteine deaminase